MVGGLSLLLSFQKERGLDRISIFRGWLIAKMGCSFYIKNRLKYKIFNDKKSLKTKIFFSVITKNLNWKKKLYGPFYG